VGGVALEFAWCGGLKLAWKLLDLARRHGHATAPALFLRDRPARLSSRGPATPFSSKRFDNSISDSKRGPLPACKRPTRPPFPSRQIPPPPPPRYLLLADQISFACQDAIVVRKRGQTATASLNYLGNVTKYLHATGRLQPLNFPVTTRTLPKSTRGAQANELHLPPCCTL
jgi:hypothetical protein